MTTKKTDVKVGETITPTAVAGADAQAATDNSEVAAQRRAAEMIATAETKAAEIIAAAEEKYAEAEARVNETIALAQTRADAIIEAATGEAADIEAAKKVEAEAAAKVEADADAAKARTAEKKKRAKAKERALKAPQKIDEKDLPAAILLAGELGDMPGDISGLMARLKANHGAEFDGEPPIHTVKIYGLTASGPAGFHAALKNWAAAVRRIAAKQAA